MCREVVTVHLDATLRELQALFARTGEEVLPVVSRDESGWMRRVVGVATRAELLRRLLSARSARALALLRTQTVAEVLRRVSPLQPADELLGAAEQLLRSGLAALPVTEADGRILGTVSISDVLARTERHGALATGA